MIARSPYPYAPVRFLKPRRGLAEVPDVNLPKISPAWVALSTVSMALSAYHGYKRNNSVGWALAWGFLGAMFPVIVPTIALAEGYGEKAK